MKIKLADGMEFKAIDNSNSQFTIHKYDFYGDGAKVWCAFTGKEIYPLDELVMSEYMPKVNGMWLNEENEYVE